MLNDFVRDHNDIFSIYNFPTYKIEIDFNEPQKSAAQLSQYTAQVEQECPVAKHFGISGIGEGIVWREINYGPTYGYCFKTKGQKFAVGSETKINEPENYAEIGLFINKVVTENRLQQGLAELEHKPTRKDIGKFVHWVRDDVLREEAGTIEQNNFSIKAVSKLVSGKASKFILNYLQEN